MGMMFLDYEQARKAVEGYQKYTGSNEMLNVEYATSALDNLYKYEFRFCKHCTFWDPEEEICENDFLCRPHTRQYDYCSFAEGPAQKPKD